MDYALTLGTKIRFGKYKDKRLTVRSLIEHDNNYATWLIGSWKGFVHKEVTESLMHHIQKEFQEELDFEGDADRASYDISLSSEIHSGYRLYELILSNYDEACAYVDIKKSQGYTIDGLVWSWLNDRLLKHGRNIYNW